MKDCERQLKAFNAAWARLQHEVPGWPLDPIDRAFHIDLLSWLTFHDAMLLGELPTRMLDYLKNNPAAPEKNLYDHVLVDEYQDLNKADQVLVDLLASRASLVVIGDEDQSIYGGLRHAEPEGIRDFASTHPGTLSVPLSDCRRCPAVVVSMANQLIQLNPGRESRVLNAYKTEQGYVGVVQWRNQEEEANGIAQYLTSYIAANPTTKLSEILVMSPRRLHGNPIRKQLEALGVPATSYFFEKPMHDPVAQERYTLLCLLADPEDRVSLRCWLGLGHDDGRRDEYERIRKHAFENGVSPRAVLEQMATGDVSIPRTTGVLKRWQQLGVEIVAHEGLNGTNLLNHLFPEGAESVAELRDVCLSLIETSEEEELTAGDLRRAIIDRVINPEPPESDNRVRVMSPHKAKGLTVKLAIVTGTVQGWLPALTMDLQGAPLARELEEQRRLFYVAITRPTDALVISSFLQMPVHLAHKTQVRFTRDKDDYNLANVVSSQFLDEFGATAPAAELGESWLAQIEVDEPAA